MNLVNKKNISGSSSVARQIKLKLILMDYILARYAEYDYFRSYINRQFIVRYYQPLCLLHSKWLHIGCVLVQKGVDSVLDISTEKSAPGVAPESAKDHIVMKSN